jgi:hypothetical protein
MTDIQPRDRTLGSNGSRSDKRPPTMSDAQREGEPAHKLPADLAEAMRGRATQARRKALMLLLIMMCAMIAGGVAFYNAGKLVLQERDRKHQSAQDALNDARALTARTKADSDRLRSVLEEDLKVLQESFEKLQPLSGQRIRDLIQEQNYSGLATFVRSVLADPNVVTAPGGTDTLSQALTDVGNNVRAMREAQQTYGQASAGEVSAQNAYSGALAAVADSSSGTLDSIALRATIAVLLIFLVQILSALQRYNVQVAAHYDAAGDALLLSADAKQRLSVSEFNGLIGALRPSANLGRAPKTVPQEVAELLVAGLKRG